MADFATLVADVKTITNKPELITETELAVKSATLQLHRSDFFYKDLLETALQFSAEGYLQSIDYRTLFPRFRALKYLRKWDGTNEGVGDFFQIATPEDVLDSYNVQVSDIVYGAGDVLQIKSSTSILYALIGLYQNPIVADAATYSSWIALEAPYAIVWKAVQIIRSTVMRDPIGSQAAAEQAMLEFSEVKNSNILLKGD